jgi:hypothetical protein
VHWSYAEQQIHDRSDSEPDHRRPLNETERAWLLAEAELQMQGAPENSGEERNKGSHVEKARDLD